MEQHLKNGRATWPARSVLDDAVPGARLSGKLILNPWAVDLATLSVQQLSSVKKQLDDELEHLTTSFSKLRAAQTKFRECVKSIKEGVAPYVSGMRPGRIGGMGRMTLTDLQTGPFSYL